jgi:hypothetical protein
VLPSPVMRRRMMLCVPSLVRTHTHKTNEFGRWIPSAPHTSFFILV